MRAEIKKASATDLANSIAGWVSRVVRSWGLEFELDGRFEDQILEVAQDAANLARESGATVNLELSRVGDLVELRIIVSKGGRTARTLLQFKVRERMVRKAVVTDIVRKRG